MTTNAGAEAIKNEAKFGFDRPTADANYADMKERVMERIERYFRPEFLNRLDDTIIFRHLTNEDLREVVGLELKKVVERLAERGLDLQLSDDAKQFLIKKGSNLDYGARPLRRAIENFVEDPLSEELLKGEFEGKDTITVAVVKDEETGKIKRLDFKGSVSEPKPEPVAAAAGEGEDKKEG